MRWLWDSNAPHNVTFRHLHKQSATTAAGSYSLRFDTPGTYHYLCTVHGFTGVVNVG